MTEQNTVPVSRLTIATASDFLRDYAQELTQSGADGQYATEVTETVEALDRALAEKTASCTDNEEL
jgi:hypothetical protein